MKNCSAGHQGHPTVHKESSEIASDPPLSRKPDKTLGLPWQVRPLRLLPARSRRATGLWPVSDPHVHKGTQAQDGVNSGTADSSRPRAARVDGVEPGHTLDLGSGRGAHAVEFSKTAAPPREGIPLRGTPGVRIRIPGQTNQDITRTRFLPSRTLQARGSSRPAQSPAPDSMRDLAPPSLAVRHDRCPQALRRSH